LISQVSAERADGDVLPWRRVDYNLVLIDGVRVNQSGGAFDFSRLNTADINRVEVVRDAQSSLWGSDAMGIARYSRLRSS
jgi:outer membrane receptor protein involved in Fe transport